MKHLALLLLGFAVIGCNRGITPEAPAQNVSFTFTQTSSEGISGRSQELEEPAHVRLSLTTPEGDQVSHTLTVSTFSNGYVTSLLTLSIGDYQLNEFLVENADNQVIYAAPITGSDKANLVNQPLPLSFTVSEDGVEAVAVEVLAVGDATADAFGYAVFTFNVVHTFDFQVAVFIENQSTGLPELTASHLEIAAGGRTRVAINLDASTHLIEMTDSLPDYQVTISKGGYLPFEQTFTANELKAYAPGNGPLVVVLASDGMNGSWQPGDAWTDPRDGQTYGTVEYRGMVWMTENLNYGALVGIEDIDDKEGFDGIAEKLCWDADCIEGGYYTWYELMQTGDYQDSQEDSVGTRQGLCPPGWHIPTELEWRVITKGPIGAMGNIPNLIDINPNQPLGIEGGTNSSGLSLRLYGYFGITRDEPRRNYGDSGSIWTASFEKFSVFQEPVFHYMNIGGPNATLGFVGDVAALNCRCVKN